jgi:uncharacterized membrane protein
VKDFVGEARLTSYWHSHFMNEKDTQPDATVPIVAKSNIDAIMRIEQDFVRQRSRLDRISDTLINIAGSPGFIMAHVAVFAAWLVANAGILPGIQPFDSYPFGILTLFVSLEAILLTALVLMNQRRQTRQANHWAHLDLQISLLTEQETTKALQMLKAICAHLGLETHAASSELGEMVGKTPIAELAEKLAEKLEKTREPEMPRSKALGL